MTLKPLGDRVVVRAIEEEQLTAGGMFCRIRRKKSPSRVRLSLSVPVSCSTTVSVYLLR